VRISRAIREPSESLERLRIPRARLISSDSIGGTSRRVAIQQTHNQKKEYCGHQPPSKQLDPGSVLNTRYEIVRRMARRMVLFIWPRGSKPGRRQCCEKMGEAHLNPAQHEKRLEISNENHCAHSLETSPDSGLFYDYFYDEPLGVLSVMRFISGGDLATRLRRPGADESTRKRD